MNAVPVPPRWKGLKSRLATALIVAFICVTPFYFGGYAWALLVAIFASRLMYEWIRMTDPDATKLAYGISIAGLLVALAYAAQGLVLGAMTALVLATVAAVLERFRRKDAFWTAIGLPYVIVPSVIIVLLRGNEIGFATQGFSQLIFVIMVVIAADVGAYFGGSSMGGPKLAPKLSPKKTWSGAISGLLFACLVSVVAGFFIGLSPLLAVALAVPIVILSVLGDLAESMVKRRLGVKDTGALLPGHGGLLDRLDSLMVAVVGAAIIFMFVGWPIA